MPRAFSASSIIDCDIPPLNEGKNRYDWPNWDAEIREWTTTLNKNGTWEPTNPPSGTQVIPTKFVLKVKRNSNSSIRKDKARLVVLGNKQKKEEAFLYILSPVVDSSVVRAAPIIAARKGYFIHQMDATSASLKGC